MGAGEINVTCLIGAMDSLWHHQNVLCNSEHSPSLSLFNVTPKTPLQPISENSSKANISTNVTITPPHMDVSSGRRQESDHDHDDLVSTRPTTRARSCSPISSAAHQKRSRQAQYHSGYYYNTYSTRSTLRKSMSCKSLFDQLELEEVKGFMDLGFVFDKDNLSKRVMSLIPGLQRLENDSSSDNSSESNSSNDNDDFESCDLEEEMKVKNMMRPYLSEAWINMERPYSTTDPILMDLRVPHLRVSTAADMKKHLKFWARSVASAAIQLQS